MNHKAGGAMKKILTQGMVKMRHGQTQRMRTCYVLELSCGHISYITELPSESGKGRCPVCKPLPRAGTEQFHRVCSACGQHRRVYSEGLCSNCKPTPPREPIVTNVAPLADLDALVRNRTRRDYRQRRWWR